MTLIKSRCQTQSKPKTFEKWIKTVWPPNLRNFGQKLLSGQKIIKKYKRLRKVFN